MESDCWVLEPLWESSAPGALLVLISSQVRLGTKAVHSIQGSRLPIDTRVIVAILHFLRFKSDLESSRGIIRLEHRVHPDLSHFLVFKAHSKRMLHLLHLLPRNLNVDSIWSCNGPELAKTWRVSH